MLITVQQIMCSQAVYIFEFSGYLMGILFSFHTSTMVSTSLRFWLSAAILSSLAVFCCIIIRVATFSGNRNKLGDCEMIGKNPGICVVGKNLSCGFL